MEVGGKIVKFLGYNYFLMLNHKKLEKKSYSCPKNKKKSVEGHHYHLRV